MKPAGLKVWADEILSSKTVWGKRGSMHSRVLNSALCVSIMNSTTHINMIKAVRSFVVKKKLVPFVYPNFLPMLFD